MDAEVRKTGLGGTDIAAICGIHPHRTAFQVWEEKTGQAEPVEETPQMRWGLILEPVVATQFRQAHPDITAGMAMNKTTFKNPDNPLLVGTPDYLLGDLEQGLEIKTVGTFMAKGFGELGTDDVPKHHYLQCEWYMALMEYNVWHLAALIGGQDYREYRIERDSDLDVQLVGLAQSFWDKYVVTDTPPPMTASKDVSDYLKRQYPNHTDMLPVATDEQAVIYDEYWHHRKAAELAGEEAERLKNVLKFQIGDTAGLVFENGRLTWKRSKDGTKIDWKGVATDAEATVEQIAACTSVRPGSRRFLAKLTEQEG
jgi:putative phage-type endonuclease